MTKPGLGVVRTEHALDYVLTLTDIIIITCNANEDLARGAECTRINSRPSLSPSKIDALKISFIERVT